MLESLRVQFLREDLNAKSLIAALTETDPYLEATPRMLTHDQLSMSLEAITGFRWIYDGFDQLDSDLPKGHRLLLGGVDGDAIRTPQRTPGFTWALVVKRAAEAAASTVVKVTVYVPMVKASTTSALLSLMVTPSSQLSLYSATQSVHPSPPQHS